MSTIAWHIYTETQRRDTDYLAGSYSSSVTYALPLFRQLCRTVGQVGYGFVTVRSLPCLANCLQHDYFDTGLCNHCPMRTCKPPRKMALTIALLPLHTWETVSGVRWSLRVHTNVQRSTDADTEQQPDPYCSQSGNQGKSEQRLQSAAVMAIPHSRRNN